LTAILLAITWFHERDRGNADLLIEYLEHLDEAVVARAVDGLSWLGGCALTEQVLVTDPHYVVREGAIDELEDLDYKPALARVEALCADPHPHVRQAALGAIANLGGTERAVRDQARRR